MKKLPELREAMEALSGPENRGDAEGNHMDADDLLVELAQLLSAQLETWTQSKFDRQRIHDDVVAVLQAYDKVQKWYA